MWLYRLLLGLYPASFRAEYEEEMCAVFAARRRDENPLVLWTSILFDVLPNAIAAHVTILGRDLAWSVRLFRQSAGFTLTALMVASLGIGANTAAFTLLDHVLLRPLPFPHSEQLMMVYQTQTGNGNANVPASPPNFRDWQSMNRSFESMGSYSDVSANLSRQGEPRRLAGVSATAGVFQTLEVHPAIGRNFTPAEDDMGAAGVVLLSDGLSRALFGDAPAALGRTIRLDDEPYTIIGVMPAGFAFPSRTTEFWMPHRLPRVVTSDRTNLMFSVIGRLRPGVSPDQARADLNRIGHQLAQSYPKEDIGTGATAVEMHKALAPRSQMLVIAVFGAAFCLMMIACTNLANLLLARSLTRRREIAVRIAIGAGRERILRQLLTENLVLALAGGAAGIALAAIATPSLALLVPDALPISGVPHLDLRVLGFAAALTILTSIAFGVGPALRASGEVDMHALRTRSGAGGRSDRLRRGLVLAEIAGTVILLVGAGLLTKALWRIQRVDPGFRSENVLTMRTSLPMPKYREVARRTQFYSQVLSGAQALPGVTSAAYISFLPMVFGGGIFPVTAQGVPADPAAPTQVSIRYITPQFFKTLGIPLRRGRDVSDRDTFQPPLVAVISESLARRFWPGQDPIGRRLNVAFFDRTVVGVVADISVRGVERTSEPQIYMSAQQAPDGSLMFFAPKDLVIHATDHAAALAPALRRIIHEADPEQAIADVQLLDEIVASETASRRAQLDVLAAFAAIAFLLAGVGIHGLLSFAVSTRTEEVGVRVALGAEPHDILKMFLRQGAVLGMAGVALALPLAYLAARGMGALLFDVKPGDPLIYAAAAALALGMTLTGSLRPALRAASIDPAITMRAE